MVSLHDCRRGLVAATLGLGVAVPAGATDDDGRLGLRYQAIDEGLLVTSTTEGLGADRAGVTPGTLLVAADGTSLLGAPRDARRLLVGPAGSTLELTVVDPLSDTRRTVTVERTVPAARSHAGLSARPPSVAAYRKAVREKSRRKAVAAAEAMVADDFGGMPPRLAVGASLATAMRRGDRFARDVATVLADARPDDPRLLQGLSRVLLNTGRAEAALALLDHRATIDPPDLTLVDGGPTVDLGGSFQARALHIDAAVQSGDRTAATALARSLLDSHRDPGVAALVGMAPAVPSVKWHAALPPVTPFTVPLLDGRTWSSADHLGEVVVLNFWATWCGPCKQELPELAELYAKRSGEGIEVLAVSTDTGEDEPVAAMAKKMGLPFPVGRAPDLMEPFRVSAIPAIRVLGPDGAQHYSARGYSEGAMEKLDQAIDQARESGSEGGAPLAEVWGAAADSVELVRFFPMAGAEGVTASAADVVVGAVGSTPAIFHRDGTLRGEATVSATRGQPGARLGWIDGAVAVDPGRHLVRKWDADGSSVWIRGLPEPALDLVTTDRAIWVAGAETLYVLDADGTPLHAEPVALTDLAVRADGAGVLGVGPTHRIDARIRWPEPTPPVEVEGEASTPGDSGPPLPAAPPVVEVARTPAPRGAVAIDGAGNLAGSVVRHMVSGRFGPGGAQRVAVVRADDRLLILDGEGAVAVVAELRRGGPLLATDFDGDGQDSLLVTIPDHGVVWLEPKVP